MTIRETIKTTCPRDCYDACGITVTKKDGVIANVLGDRDHPVSRGALCGKCAVAYNGAWRDENLRLTQPLKRIGTKGRREFKPMSWDEALNMIAARLHDAIDRGCARSILHTHYTGTVGLLGGAFPNRFFNRIGATEVDPDTVCNKAGHAALEMVFGTSVEGFDPRSARGARCIVVWGANPSHSAPHQDEYWLKEAQRAGSRIIVVDPIAHGTAAGADIHLKLRPGSDSALAFGLLHVLSARNLIDEAFLAHHVVGAEELRPAIAAMTPARTAELCGLPEDLIEKAAIAYGEGPSLLWLGQGVQRQPMGGNIFRALGALVAFTGNLGKHGAGFCYINGAAMRGIDMALVTEPALARDGTGTISHMDLARVLEDPSRAQVLFNWNNNPAASSPEQGRLRRALEREDLFHVAIDLFHTDTTAYADIVLPAASFLEFDDLVLSYFDLTVSAQVKAVEPPGGALRNSEIFRRLARAMGFNDAALYEPDDRLIERLLAATPYRGSFADLAKLGTAELYPEPRIQFADLTFATPSGRIELASNRAERQGLPRVPLPHADPLPAEGRLRILSPAGAWLMNSSYGNDKVIRRRLGPATITLHPTDAEEAGFASGDPVLLVNETGRLLLSVVLSEATQRGVGVVHKGRWTDAVPGAANINALVSGRKSDMAGSTTVHGTEARLLRPQ